MARESTQQKLSRVRPPRVHITYEVEVGDAIVMKELPFVVGLCHGSGIVSSSRSIGTILTMS